MLQNTFCWGVILTITNVTSITIEATVYMNCNPELGYKKPGEVNLLT
jgi:hypothetical protein